MLAHFNFRCFNIVYCYIKLCARKRQQLPKVILSVLVRQFNLNIGTLTE
jgi:hypothetical protein